MEKATKRVTISFSDLDIKRLESMKIKYNQKTYSKVLQQLVRYGKI